MTDPDGADRFEYDALDRLKKVTREVGGVDVAVEDYDYNALGALKVNAGVALDTQRPRLDGGGMADSAVPATLGGMPVTLNGGGFVTSLKGTSFTWSERGFLREAQDPVPAALEHYGYDSRMRRISKQQSGDAEFYVYEGLDRVATIGAGGALREQYLFDGIDHPLRIKIASASTVAYYELDLAGNVRGLRANGGSSLGGYRYRAFGETLEDTATISQPLRWKARWFSTAGAGVYDVRARQWAPQLAAFLTIDEYDYHDDTVTLWGWPGQNPIEFSDPMGRGGICDWFPWLPGCGKKPPKPTPPKPTPPSGCEQGCQDAFAEAKAQCKKTWGTPLPPPPPGCDAGPKDPAEDGYNGCVGDAIKARNACLCGCNIANCERVSSAGGSGGG